MKKLLFVLATLVVLALVALGVYLNFAATCSTEKKCKAPEPYVKKLLIGKDKSVSCRASKLPYKLGIARYTMWNTSFERVLDIVEALDCGYLSLIEGTIARDASDEEIAAYKKRLASRGIIVDTLGPVYYEDEATIEAAFSFAKRYGMTMISVVPYEKRVIDGKERHILQGGRRTKIL